ncbi:SWEET sugar transporter [Cynara cardunculus var. scolymus]|uniref:Bidirectional sugar transporter SWEET n=1 Tax=Cynara cardunculus var. scolymus TaxID=59895 RepID=A0A118K3M8_CYNCS|nr:SWEET sugar transporter [Cynara cardunculus var. scolymus]
MVGNLAHLTLAFGLLGNIVSFMVFLAPMYASYICFFSFYLFSKPTFYRVYKKKSTEGFQSEPYVVGLFSAMLWIYYALLKSNVLLLITINSVGCFIETLYICFFLVYAPKKARKVGLTKRNLVMQMESLKLIVLLIVVGFGLIVVLTQFFASGVTRGVIVGWICLVFSLCVFVAPLGVLRQVIKTKSVEYMPILLSVALTLSAVMWFFYGLLLGDFNIAIPNVLGFTFGIIQMILYFVYKNKKPIINEKMSEKGEQKYTIGKMEEQKMVEVKDHKTIDVVKLSANLLSPDVLPVVAKLKENEHDAVPVAVHEPEARPTVPNHIIEVAV